MKNAAIIGGGFYGCCLAIYLHKCGLDVRIFEREKKILQRASTLNQARIHMGYHYPRNIITAYRSYINCPKFVNDFKESVDDNFTKLYCIARIGSKVSADQFRTIYTRMRAEIKPASKENRALFSQDYIEEVFEVNEYAFDSKKLQKILEEKIDNSKIQTVFDAEVNNIEPRGGGGGFIIRELNGDDMFAADIVFNCTYSGINTLRQRSKLPMLPFKHELAEIVLVDVPDIIKTIGITVMDGPFFSIMPYPARRRHSLSHVRYTPHRRWVDGDAAIDGESLIAEAKNASNFDYMIKDASRFMPLMSEVDKVDSFYEIKTILINNEGDDGRPILFYEDTTLPGSFTIMGGKIDNIYDILEVLSDIGNRLGFKSVSLDDLFRS